MRARSSSYSPKRNMAPGCALLRSEMRGREPSIPNPERLGDVIVRTEVEAQDDVFLLALGGQHEDGVSRPWAARRGRFHNRSRAAA